MKATWEKLEKNWMQFSVEVEPERFDRAVHQAYRKLVQRANIPGFRRGKAPRWVFEQYQGKAALLNEAVESLLPEAYVEAVDQGNVAPIDQPQVDVEQAEEGKPFVFKGKVEVKPDVTLGRLSGFDIAYPEVTVTEEQVDAQVEEMRQRLASLVPDPDGEVRKGAFATIDFAGFRDGEPLEGAQAEGYNLEVGSDRFIPGFEDHLIGARTGETREFEITFPDDYHVEPMAGQSASFKVTVRDVKKKELPELNDEFAAQVSALTTLKELREDVTNRLTEAANAQAERDFRNRILEAVAADATVEVPEVLVHRRVHQLMEDMAQNFQYQGISLEQYLAATGKGSEELHEEFREPAQQQVKVDLAVEAAAGQLGIEVTDADVDAEFDAMAEAYKGRAADVARLRNSDYRERIRESLLKQQTVARLLEMNRPEAGAAAATADSPSEKKKAAKSRKPKAAKEAADAATVDGDPADA